MKKRVSLVMDAKPVVMRLPEPMPKEGFGDLDRLKVDRLLSDPHYALLLGELEKNYNKYQSYYKQGVYKQVVQLLQTAKLLGLPVREDFLKKAYDWYVCAMGGKKKEPEPYKPLFKTAISEPQSEMPSQKAVSKLPSSVEIEKDSSERNVQQVSQKLSGTRPQSGINPPSRGPTIARPLTAAAARKLIRPDSSKLTLASTKIASYHKANHEYYATEILGYSRHLDGFSRHLDICEELSDYSNAYRTIHPEVEAPIDTLNRMAKESEKSKFHADAVEVVKQSPSKSLKKADVKNIEENNAEEYVDQIICDVENTEEDEEDAEDAEQQEVLEQDLDLPQKHQYRKFQRYESEGGQQTANAEHLLTAKNNLLAADRRENEELTQLISYWRQSKSRQMKYSNRRIESAKLARPQSAKLYVLRTAYLQNPALREAPTNLYTLPAKRPLTKCKTLNRYKSTETIGNHLTSCIRVNNHPPFNPLDPSHLETENQQNLDQIDSVRRLLGRNSNIPIQSLTKALLYNRYQQQQLASEYPHNYLMMHNPFIKKKPRKLKKKRATTNRR